MHSFIICVYFMNQPLLQHAFDVFNVQTQKQLTLFYTMDASNTSTDPKEVELTE